MFSLHQSNFLIEKHLDQRLTETKNISFAQFLVLLPIRYHRFCSQSAIADSLSLTEATVSRHMTALTEENMLTRKEDPVNRRKHILALTAKGEKSMDKAQEVIEEVLKDVFDVIPLKERAYITSAFDQVTSNLITKIK